MFNLVLLLAWRFVKTVADHDSYNSDNDIDDRQGVYIGLVNT